MSYLNMPQVGYVHSNSKWLKLVPISQNPCARFKLHRDMVWHNWHGRASIPLNAFGMNSNVDCTPVFFT